MAEDGMGSGLEAYEMSELDLDAIEARAHDGYDLSIPGDLSTADKNIDLGGVSVDYDDVDHVEALAAAEFLVAAKGDVQAMAREIRRLREEARWIPVEERLPDEEDDGEIVLVFRPDYGSAQQKYFQNGHFVHENGRNADDVTHWRPLPAPPEVK